VLNRKKKRRNVKKSSNSCSYSRKTLKLERLLWKLVTRQAGMLSSKVYLLKKLLGLPKKP
jgi:hypothetical protein